MTITSALANSKLTWSYPGADGHEFVLRADGAEIGRLRFTGDADVRSAAELEGQRWTFVRTAARCPRISIYAEGSETPTAQFMPCMTGGTVSFAGGRRYCWTRAHLWSTCWCFRCEEHKSSVCVSQEAGPLAGGGQVTVCASAASLAETPVLVLLAWYLRVLEFEKLAETDFVCG